MVLVLLFPIKLWAGTRWCLASHSVSEYKSQAVHHLQEMAVPTSQFSCRFLEQFTQLSSNWDTIQSWQSTSVLHLISTSIAALQEEGFYQVPCWAFLWSPPCQRPSHLADLHHIQLCLQTGQGGIVMATSTLGHSTPLLTLGIIAAHEENGHHPTCRRGKHRSSHLLQDKPQLFKEKSKEPKLFFIFGNWRTLGLWWLHSIRTYTKLNRETLRCIKDQPKT